MARRDGRTGASGTDPSAQLPHDRRARGICATATTYFRRASPRARENGLFPTVTAGSPWRASRPRWAGSRARARRRHSGLPCRRRGVLPVLRAPRCAWPGVPGQTTTQDAPGNARRSRRLRRRPGACFRAALGRACGLPADVVLASLPGTTTGLACTWRCARRGPSLAAAGCALSGTIGSAGRGLMDAMRIRGATARGAATARPRTPRGRRRWQPRGRTPGGGLGVVFALSGVVGAAVGGAALAARSSRRARGGFTFVKNINA